MSEIEVLRQKARAANLALSEAEDARRRAECEPLIGKCYRYRNSYSDGAKWWLYYKVTGFDGMFFTGISFQIDTHDCIRIEPRAQGVSLSGYTEISAEEFAEAWGQVAEAVRLAEEAAL